MSTQIDLANANGKTVSIANPDTNNDAKVLNATAFLSADNFLHIQHQEASGTNGGATVAGWQDRPINTVLTNNINSATLLSNVISLPLGSYMISAQASSHTPNQTRIRVTNVTDAVTEIAGINNYDGGGTAICEVDGMFTLTAVKDIKIEQFCYSAIATNGFGTFDTSGAEVEVYADIKIWKVG